jgi:galactoside O-acetyltransferase
MISSALDLVARAVVSRRVRVQVGQGSRFRWRSLLSCRGGNLRIGENSLVLPRRIDFDGPDGMVTVGRRTFVGSSQLVCRSAITIGDDVLVSWGVTIVDHNSHSLEWELRRDDVAEWMAGRKRWDHVKVAPVVIGNRSWIGFGASILKGVTIGEGAVIGACAVVTRDVTPFTVVAGNPAQEIRALSRSACHDRDCD